MKVQPNLHLTKSNTAQAPEGASDIMQMLMGAKSGAVQGKSEVTGFMPGQNVQMDNAQFMQEFTEALANASAEAGTGEQNLTVEQLLAQAKLQLSPTASSQVLTPEKNPTNQKTIEALAALQNNQPELTGDNVTDLTKIIKSLKQNENTKGEVKSEKNNQAKPLTADMTLAGIVTKNESELESTDSKLDKLFTAGMMPAKNINKGELSEAAQKNINKLDVNSSLQNVELMERSRGLKAYGESSPLNAGIIAKKNNSNMNVKEEKLRLQGAESQSDSLLNINSMNTINTDATKTVLPSRPVAQVNMSNVPSQTPVFDMSKINSSQSEQIIQQVTQYLQQSQIRNGKELNLTVNHESLGQFKINAKKMKEGAGVNLEINTMGDAAHKFFVKHENELMNKLSLAGVKITDFKVSHSSGQQNASFDSSHQDQSKASLNFGQAQGEAMNSRNGEQRRKDLWQYYQAYKEGMAA